MTLPSTAPLDSTSESTPLAAPPKRLMSLDVFRGATIALMILVNNPGSWSTIYPPLKHASWDGCTPTDLVFPFFLFIVGVAIPFAQSARLKRLPPGASKGSLLPGILRRSAVLFLLGFAISAIPMGRNSGILNWTDFRIMGVLQRIAICYAIAAILALLCSVRAQVLAAIGLMVVYCVLMFAVPVPGHAAGDWSREGNLAAYIDTQIFGRHVWIKPPDDPSRFGWEPEGLLSTLPAIGTTVFGVLTGLWLRTRRDEMTKVAGVLVFGVFGAALGYVLDGLLMPINKGLWTPSYAVYTAGLAMLALGAIYWIIDIHGWRLWAKPLQIMGMNAITVFVLSGLIARALGAIPISAGEKAVSVRSYVWQNYYKALPIAELNASLLYALTWVLGMFLLTWVMWRFKIFLKA